MSRVNKASVVVENDVLHVRGTVDGKRYQRSTGKKNTPRNLTWVESNTYDVLLQIIVEKEKPQEHNNSNNDMPTLQEYGFESLRLGAHNRVSNTTKEYLADFKSQIIPYFGVWKLNEIRPRDLKKWQSDLLKTRTGVRVINIRNVFHGILQDAFMDELIDENPFKRVPRPKKEKSKIFPFSLKETQTLINNAEGWFKNYLTIAFFSGMRSGEMIALRWKDIDFEQNKIYVRKSMRKGEVTETKTENSIRNIDMLPIVKKALLAQQKKTASKEFVFVTQYGKQYKRTDKISSYQWKPLLEKCCIKHRILYKTRHTFASVMIQQGEEVAWVSKMMGHADISITLSKYTDYLPRDDIERAAFLSNFKV